MPVRLREQSAVGVVLADMRIESAQVLASCAGSEVWLHVQVRAHKDGQSRRID
jgi:hypothetical protein